MKDSGKAILALLLFFAVLSGNRNGVADDPPGKKQELWRIQREMREKQKEITRADRKERSILTELDRIDRNVHAGKVELAAQQRLLRDAENSLRDIEKNNAAISRDLTGLKEAYGRRIRALYKMGRMGYAEAIVTADGLNDLFKRIKYLSMIIERDRIIMRDYGSALDRLAQRQTEIAERQAAILERKRAIEVQKAVLESRKKKKASLLESVRGKKSLYEEALRELEESSISLWAMVKQAEQEQRSAKGRLYEPQTNSIRSSDRKGLPWPVQGEVLTHFGMQRHPQFGIMVFRRGIEIEASEDAPVRAVSDGQVVYADWYKGYGNLLILEHGPGFYSLYGNLSQLNLNRGERAVRGQVIGLAGDAGNSKGSKLYFEIRRNGEATDPLALLVKK